jgi:hypothetical protein
MIQMWSANGITKVGEPSVRPSGSLNSREQQVKMIFEEVFEQAGRDGRSDVIVLVRIPFQDERPDASGSCSANIAI